MALALNKLKRVDMPLNKETKPNQPKNKICYIVDFAVPAYPGDEKKAKR